MYEGCVLFNGKEYHGLELVLGRNNDKIDYNTVSNAGNNVTIRIYNTNPQNTGHNQEIYLFNIDHIVLYEDTSNYGGHDDVVTGYTLCFETVTKNVVCTYHIDKTEIKHLELIPSQPTLRLV